MFLKYSLLNYFRIDHSVVLIFDSRIFWWYLIICIFPSAQVKFYKIMTNCTVFRSHVIQCDVVEFYLGLFLLLRVWYCTVDRGWRWSWIWSFVVFFLFSLPILSILGAIHCRLDLAENISLLLHFCEEKIQCCYLKYIHILHIYLKNTILICN